MKSKLLAALLVAVSATVAAPAFASGYGPRRSIVRRTAHLRRSAAKTSRRSLSSAIRPLMKRKARTAAQAISRPKRERAAVSRRRRHAVSSRITDHLGQGGQALRLCDEAPARWGRREVGKGHGNAEEVLEAVAYLSAFILYRHPRSSRLCARVKTRSP